MRGLKRTHICNQFLILFRKAFKNGKFFDPIGDSVKRQLYIQDIDAKAESSIKSKSAKLSFYKKAVDGTGKLDISAPTKASFTKDPQTCVEQALALSKTKGIESYKIKYDLVKKLSKAESTKLKESNAGSKWFNMPAPIMTPELKRDLELLSLRNVLDRKRFYKRTDKQPVSKFLQVGTIVEDKSEFYSARIVKKDRKSNMVQELLHDSGSQEYFNSRFNQLQQNAAQNCRKPSTKRFKNSYSKRK
ncbi:dTDP-fucopyranose mutase, variant 2 [Entomophthora muscae]|uniref:dTDP-fucopyranose mutase, variant 2 n=1 Tax=Entomophthora muscae TaxID=34485 RepID=A0ACC2RLW9_9FUNG|nr:dTDP-fucopyranose mutase, variant 2 [Entomophthora muscae]